MPARSGDVPPLLDSPPDWLHLYKKESYGRPLIVHLNGDILLLWRDYRILCLAPEIRQLLHCISDDCKSRSDLVFCDDQWRCEPDDVSMGGFGLNEGVISTDLIAHTSLAEEITHQQTLFLEQHAKIPRAVSASLTFIDHDGVQQTPPSPA